MEAVFEGIKKMKFYGIICAVCVGIKNVIYRRFFPFRIKPKHLVFEVTRRCNSKCKHCRTWTKKENKTEMSCAQLRIMLCDPLFSRLESAILTGGEPSLREDLYELIHVFHRHNPKIHVWISTNGLLRNRIIETVKKCLENNINIGVGISLDGVARSHDTFRGVDGSFLNATALMSDLKELGVVSTVGFTLSTLTAQNYFELKEWLNSDYPLLVQKFDCSEFYGTQKKPLVVSDAERKVVEDLPNNLLKRYWLNPKRWSCYAFHSFFFLHCDGNVSSCLRNYDKIYGNMCTQKPSVLWKNLGNGRRNVKSCNPQCLNDWGLNYSLEAAYFPVLFWKMSRKIFGTVKRLVKFPI